MSKAKFGKEKGKNEKLALIQRPVFDFKSKEKKKKKTILSDIATII